MCSAPDYIPPVSMLMFALPLEVGKTWDMSASGTSSTKGSVVSKENVTAPAGNFDCYKVAIISTYTYRGTPETYTSYIWLGNNVGIVKSGSSSSTIESVLEWKNF